MKRPRLARLHLATAAALSVLLPHAAVAQDLPTDPIIQIVPDNQPADSLALQQPFLLKVRIPELSDPQDSVTVKLKTYGSETSLTLHRIGVNDGYVEFGYGEYISIGGKRGGLNHNGTLNGLELSNGEALSFELTGFTRPTTTTIPVYDNTIQQGIARNQDSLRTIGEHLVRQKSLLAEAARAPSASDPEVADALRQAQWEVDLKLGCLTDIRDMLEREDTPKGKLLIGNNLIGTLINTFNGLGAIGSGINTPLDPRAQWRDATNNAGQQAGRVATDVLESSISAMALSLYQTVVTLTGAEGLWKAVEGTDAFGNQVTTGQRVFGAFEFGGQFVLVVGLPKFLDFLADSGHRSVRLPGRTPTTGAPRIGGTPAPGAPRPATPDVPAAPAAAARPPTGTPDTTATVRIPPPAADPAMAPTVRTGPETQDPTVRTGPETQAPTVRTGPETQAPTVRTGPETQAPTVRTGPETQAPTVKMTPTGNPDTTPTVRIPPPGADPATAPTVRTGPETQAPTVRTGPETQAPTVRTGPETQAPTVRTGPETQAPTVRTGPETQAPTVRTGPETQAPTVKMPPTGNPDTSPTVRIPPPGADPAPAPTVRTGPETQAPTVRTGPETQAPTVRTDPEAGAPTVREPAPAAAAAPRPATGDDAVRPNRLDELNKREVKSDDAADRAEMLDEYNEALDAARRSGVPTHRIDDITRGAEPGDPAVTYKLLKARLETEGFDLRPLPPPRTIALDELTRIRTLTVRIRRGNVTEDDWRWVRDRLGEDPAYFDKLAKRAYTNETREGLPTQADEAVIFIGDDAKLLKDFFGDGSAGRPVTGGSPAAAPAGGAPPAGPPKPGAGDTTEILPPPELAPPPTGRPPTGPPTGSSAPPSGGGASPGSTAVTAGTGAATNALLPSISFLMEPYDLPSDQTFVGPEEDAVVSSDPSTWETFPLFAGPGEDGVPISPWDFFGGEFLAGNDPVAATAPADPTTQRMISIIDDLQPIVVIAGTPAVKKGPAVARAARSLWNVLTRAGSAGPRALASGTVGDSAGEVWLAPLSPSGTAGPQKAGGTPAIRAFVTSLGTSTGEAFQVHIVNDTGRPVRVGGGSLVLEPISGAAQAKLQQHVQQLAGKPNVASVRMTAYCLEFLRQPPSKGMMFRIAGKDLQQRFGAIRSVLDAAKKLQQGGLLKPDSDPTAYFHAIRQWTIWSKEQRFDLKAFGKAFVARTKQNFEQLGQNWSKELEQAVLARVPGRWQDIQRVLREAERVQEAR